MSGDKIIVEDFYLDDIDQEDIDKTRTHKNYLETGGKGYVR